MLKFFIVSFGFLIGSSHSNQAIPLGTFDANLSQMYQMYVRVASSLSLLTPRPTFQPVRKLLIFVTSVICQGFYISVVRIYRKIII